MSQRVVHQCACEDCQVGDVAVSQQHQQLNLLMSRLDEQQRRWMAAVEANRRGHGGTQQLSQITGLDINTIRRGRRELAAALVDRPVGRVRQAGGGRKPAEKK
jgi:hypothetical protein